MTYNAPNPTVEEAVLEWITYRQASGRIGQSTVLQYITRLMRLPELFRNRKVRNLHHVVVQSAIMHVIRNYSIGAAREVFTLLNAVFKHLHNTDIILRNPMRTIEAPRAPATRKTDTMSAVDVLNAVVFAYETGPKWVYHFMTILAATGMRVGEAAALTRDDMDFERCRIRINKTLARGLDGPYIGKTKTTASTRYVSLPSATMKGLQEQYENLSAGTPLFLFDRPDQPLPGVSKFTDAVKKVLVRAGLGKYSAHDLRHAHATQLLRAGNHVKAVATRLGHSNPALTMSVYAHALPQDDEKMVNAAAELVRGATG